MITAKEARFKSENQQKINQILTKLQQNIDKAVENGVNKTSVDIELDTSQEIRNNLTTYLTELGYSVVITNNEEINREMGTYSIEQGYYYDSINISW